MTDEEPHVKCCKNEHIWGTTQDKLNPNQLQYVNADYGLIQ